MQAHLGTRIGSVQQLWREFRRRLAALAQGWRRLVGGPYYRPEKHYMRGPGPKWRAKYAEAEAPRSTGAAPAGHDAARGR